MTTERVKFEAVAIATVFDHELFGEMPGVFLSFKDAEKLDGVICEVRSTHWTKWHMIKAWFIKRRLNKLLRI